MRTNLKSINHYSKGSFKVSIDKDSWSPAKNVATVVRQLYNTMNIWHGFSMKNGGYASRTCALQLLCLGANISGASLIANSSLLNRIEKRMESLEDGLCVQNFYSPEEKKFLLNLALILTIKIKSNAWRIFCLIQSFVTYHGLFVAPGFEIGGIWRDIDLSENVCTLCMCQECLDELRRALH